jgi:cell division protein FtsZ
MMSNSEFGSISFDLPKNQSNVIKVIGVGGGGSNAINTCLNKELKAWILSFVILILRHYKVVQFPIKFS